MSALGGLAAPLETVEPMRHRTVRVRLDRLLATGDGFLVVVAEAPVEVAIEPAPATARE
jgi:hypothetical protein